MATLLDAGAAVTLLTCTRGERGEVIPPDLQHLSGEALGIYRESELATAMSELHVTDHRFLGGDGARPETVAPHRFVDSGMQWGLNGAEPLAAPAPTPSQTSSAMASPSTTERDGVTFTDASLEQLVSDIASVIDEVNPTAVISYDSKGGYGHPDHVKAHEAASIAALMRNIPFFAIVAESDSDSADIRVDVNAVLERKKRALQAYRTQLTVVGDTIVHSGGQVEHISTVEVFRRQEGAELHQPSMEWKDLGWLSRVSACVFALLVGVVMGFIGGVQHSISMGAISLLISAGFLVGLRLLFQSRVVSACAALGLLVVVGLFSLESPGGSVLIQADAAGFIWSYALPVVALFVLVWPRVGKRSRDTMEKKSDPGKVVGAS